MKLRLTSKLSPVSLLTPQKWVAARQEHTREQADGVARLCAMNLLLHGIGGDPQAPVPILVKDALGAKHGEYEMVLTNPPFGTKSSVTIVNEAGDEEKQALIVHRDDFWATTSNKQLNFLQHVFAILKQHGLAASSSQKRSKLSVVAEGLQLLGNRPESGSKPPPAKPAAAAPVAQPQMRAPARAAPRPQPRDYKEERLSLRSVLKLRRLSRKFSRFLQLTREGVSTELV